MTKYLNGMMVIVCLYVFLHLNFVFVEKKTVCRFGHRAIQKSNKR